ncbi:MAG: hypothetical protein IKA76_01315 [Clostridia bacterium]|nr:hypothetical protein [Clostridia bacterium]
MILILGMVLGMELKMTVGALRFPPMAPLTPLAPPAPPASAGSACLRRLSEQEKEDLISFGIPSGYIEERRSRAEEYGREHGQSPMDVLLSWWREDEKRERRKPRASPEEKREIPKSYDLDEFFEAAIRRGLCDLSATEGGGTGSGTP